MKQTLTTLILIFIWASTTFAQSEYVRSIDFELKITDDSTLRPIRNPKVISYSTFEVFQADSTGYLNILLAQTDSVRVAALGYYPLTIKISSLSEKYLNHYSLVPYVYLLPEVRIRPNMRDSIKINLHMPSDILMGYKSDVPMRLRPTGPSGLGMLMNPVGALYSVFSDAEASKEKVLKLMKERKIKENRDYVLMTKDIIEEESGFTGDSLQHFIVQCNVHIKISQFDNEIRVRRKIQLLADEYRYKASQTVDMKN